MASMKSSLAGGVGVCCCFFNDVVYFQTFV